MSTLSPRPEAIVDALSLRPRQANPRLAAILKWPRTGDRPTEAPRQCSYEHQPRALTPSPASSPPIPTTDPRPGIRFSPPRTQTAPSKRYSLNHVSAQHPAGTHDPGASVVAPGHRRLGALPDHPGQHHPLHGPADADRGAGGHRIA